MKKIISLIVCVVLLMSFCITANAAGTAVLNGDSSVTTGNNIEFTVNVSGCMDATSIGVSVTYDDNFELVSGNWLKNGSLSTFDTSTKKGALGVLASPDVNGNIFKLVLKAKTASANAQNVSVNVIVKNGSTEIMNVVVSKSVEINDISYIHGDIDGDEEVSATDLALLKLCLAGAMELEDTAQLAADIDGSGAIDATDLAILKLVLAGAYTL